MKGIIVEKVGGEYKLSDAVEKPTPGKNQILVKAVATALNPVEAFQQGTGLLVSAWPIVLGCDGSGTVVEVGEGVTKFKVGDKAFGCSRLGDPGYGTFQEFFIMDEKLAFKTKPGALNAEQAATVGVGLLTAGLALLSGLKAVLDVDSTPKLDEWLIVLGGAGSVGQYAVKLAKKCGYKVLASCSPSNSEALKGIGADATFNYKQELAQQLEEIKSITGGKFSRVFDAAAMSTETGMNALAKVSDEKVKIFATTNDWVPVDPIEGVEVYIVALGRIGKEGGEGYAKDNDEIMAMIPLFEKCLDNGSIKPMEYETVDGVGVESVLKGIEVFGAKKSSWKKFVIKIAEE